MNVIELIVCIFHFENRRPVFEDLNASPNRLTFDTHVEFWLKTVNTRLKAKKIILSCEDWGSTLHWIFHLFCSLVRLDFLKFCWWKHKTNARLKSFRRWFFLHTNLLISLINIQRYWLLVFPCVGFFMPSQREGERSIDKFKCQFHNKCARARIDAIKFKLWVFIHLQMSFVAR